MGTKGIIRILEDGEPLVGIEESLDGGPDSLGLGIKDFLKNMKIVNGYTSDMKIGEYANGMGDLAAQLICGLKDGVGDIEVVRADDTGDWEYEIYDISGLVGLRLIYDGVELYDGLVRDWVMKVR